jgi:tRNA threonylcarbamoyladenosine biosynthesis protein TsaB
MKILAIDTSSDRAAVVLSVGNQEFWEANPTDSRRHGRDLLPAIRDLLGAASIRVADLNLIGVGLGPGSYTGLRIGLTAARILAYTSKADLVGFDSLEAVAGSAPPGAPRVVVVSDAQRGAVYTAEFRRTAPGSELAPVAATRIEPLESWAARLQPGTMVMGPGLASGRIRAAIPAGVATPSDEGRPSQAWALIELVARHWKAGRRDDLWTLEPNYLRRSAAEDQWDARARS